MKKQFSIRASQSLKNIVALATKTEQTVVLKLDDKSVCCDFLPKVDMNQNRPVVAL